MHALPGTGAVVPERRADGSWPTVAGGVGPDLPLPTSEGFAHRRGTGVFGG